MRYLPIFLQRRIISDWREDVYKTSDDSWKDDWYILQRQIIRRDHNRCARCKRLLPSTRLTVHHIVSREQGGMDDQRNLITLCQPCHNYIEENNFTSLEDIQKRPWSDDEVYIEKLVDYSDWHVKVYGAGRKRSK